MACGDSNKERRAGVLVPQGREGWGGLGWAAAAHAHDGAGRGGTRKPLGQTAAAANESLMRSVRPRYLPVGCLVSRRRESSGGPVGGCCRYIRGLCQAHPWMCSSYATPPRPPKAPQRVARQALPANRGALTAKTGQPGQVSEGALHLAPLPSRGPGHGVMCLPCSILLVL